jgi:ribosomal-protein-serine acetyltransferase
MFEYHLDDKVSMRMLRLQDAEELFAAVDANRAHLRQWLPWLDDNTAAGDTKAFIQTTLDQCARNQGFVCAILQEEGIVGSIGYHPIHWQNRSVVIGYWLAEASMGQGVVTRCCRVLIDYAFREFGLNKVAIPAATKNRRSRAIPERLGFRQEGIVGDAEWLYDHFVDHVVYSVLAREWSRVAGHDSCGRYAQTARRAVPLLQQRGSAERQVTELT